MNKLQNFAAPAGRFLLALIFFTSGLSKMGQYEGTQAYMEAMSVPGVLLPVVIFTEIAGGLAIMLGWKTKVAAVALAGFRAISTLLFHADFSSQVEMINFMKNFAMAGGFLLLFSQGAGAYALDNRNKQ